MSHQKHQLKTWPEFYQLLVDYKKTFEYRKNDRSYQIGDLLIFSEWDPEEEEYTGRECYARITYIMDSCPGLPEGYCVLQIDRYAARSKINLTGDM